ncbi:DUF397 domain-containing protein [Nocardiopsis sp. ARC36]
MNQWHTSSYSGSESTCVEVAEGEKVRVRDTRNRNLARVEVPTSEWSALVSAVRTS